MFVVWAVVAAFLLPVEVFATAFYAVFIAAGLIGGAIVDAVGGPLWLQLLVIIVVSIVGVAGARPPLVRMMLRDRPNVVLKGVQGIVGQTAMTVDVVGDEHHPGHALLGGERWLAITDAAAPLPPDQTVTVAAVRGTTLVVRPAKSTAAG